MVLGGPGQVVEAVAGAEVGDRGARHRRRAPSTKRRSWRCSCAWSSSCRPADRGGGAYMRAYQLTWFSRSAGQRQNSPVVVLTMQSAIRSAAAWSSPIASRARHAKDSAHAISVSTTRCWMPPPRRPSRQPGACDWLPPLGAWSTHAGPVHQLVHERPRAVVAARRAGVAGQRGGRVREQEVGVEHRARRLVDAAAPVRIEVVLHAIGERPVRGVVPGARIGGGLGRGRRARKQQAREQGT